jgi:hypothetical protein
MSMAKVTVKQLPLKEKDIMEILIQHFKEKSEKVRIKEIWNIGDEETCSFFWYKIQIKSSIFWKTIGYFDTLEESNDYNYDVRIYKEYLESYTDVIVDLLKTVNVPDSIEFAVF